MANGGLQINTRDKREQRKFGLLIGAVLCAIGGVRSWLSHDVAIGVFGVAAVFLAFAAAWPRALGPVLFVWMKIAEALNWFMTRLLLGLAFAFLITPPRVAIRLFGDDPLKRTWLPQAPTYWEDAEEQPAEFERYFNQF